MYAVLVTWHCDLDVNGLHGGRPRGGEAWEPSVGIAGRYGRPPPCEKATKVRPLSHCTVYASHSNLYPGIPRGSLILTDGRKVIRLYQIAPMIQSKRTVLYIYARQGILPTSGGGTPPTTTPSPSPVVLLPPVLPSSGFDGRQAQGKGHAKGQGP
jgi:hypothetical protein